nr:DNA (cytosine-5-)-methyltransferase [uncultured Clostridium sp.]
MYRPWSLKDIDNIPRNGIKVFSCFSCGGGSTMGYKLAGCQVLGNCEIDQRINELYNRNHHPLYSYNMDIRDFVKLSNNDLPPELFQLDILDGSPPCSVFSMSGNREDDWGKAKRFREGQAAQTLDDLFFEFISVIRKLKPKVFIAENVKGMIHGSAKGYVSEVLNKVNEAGYKVQLFCLNSAVMGVPQRRERVFFIGHRKELPYSKLNLYFNKRPIRFGEIRSLAGEPVTKETYQLLKHKTPTDRNLADINNRLFNKQSRFNAAVVWDSIIAPTITANGEFLRAVDDLKFSDMDFINCQSFPVDYDFNTSSVQYVCGMSVPPLMMKEIAIQVCNQWFS